MHLRLAPVLAFVGFLSVFAVGLIEVCDEREGLLSERRRDSSRVLLPMREEAARQQGSLFLGRIVPTEAKPSELSGEILWLAQRRVKAKSPQR
jgi:hypothetical protein